MRLRRRDERSEQHNELGHLGALAVAILPRTGHFEGHLDFGREIRVPIDDVARLLGAAAK